jgi:hypothetical protein
VASKVFISHSNKDKATADAICNHLESAGIRCWIAPRDIPFGSDWTEGIMRGIDACKVFVVVFSEHANDSEHVRREVAKAFSQGLAVIPFRTEAVTPNRSLSYFLETVHWLDAITPPLQNHLRTLTEQVKQLLGDDQEAVPAGTKTARLESPPPIAPAPSQKPDRGGKFIGNRETPSGPSLFVSAPIKVDDKSCLECHSTPDRAPPEMVKLYGNVNGFGWKEGDVIGAQIVSVPAAVSEKIAGSAFQSLLAWLVGIGALIFALVNVAFFFAAPRAAMQAPVADSK